MWNVHLIRLYAFHTNATNAFRARAPVEQNLNCRHPRRAMVLSRLPRKIARSFCKCFLRPCNETRPAKLNFVDIEAIVVPKQRTIALSAIFPPLSSANAMRHPIDRWMSIYRSHSFRRERWNVWTNGRSNVFGSLIRYLPFHHLRFFPEMRNDFQYYIFVFYLHVICKRMCILQINAAILSKSTNRS